MMAPEAYDALGPPPVAADDGHDAGSSSGPGPVPSRAPLRWPQTMRRPPPPATDPPSPSSDSHEPCESDVEHEDERGQASVGRGHADSSDGDVSSSSDEASLAVLPTAELCSPQPGEQSEAAVQPLTRHALAARANAVFNTAVGWPTEVR